MLQFNQGKKTKKVLGLRSEAEKTFVNQLDMAVDTVTSTKHAREFMINQGKLNSRHKYKELRIDYKL
jgi:hypothetical protein